MFNVFVCNKYNEMMSFTLFDIHDALSLYYSIMKDNTVNYVSITSYHLDENGKFFDSEIIRIYERD